MKKKGQLFGQPIMYVFYAVVAILVLVFGIRIAIQLNEKSDLLKEEIFFSDLEEKFDSVYRDSYGSSISLIDLKVPSNFIELCFMDIGQEKDLSEVTLTKLKDLIGASYDAEVDDNVFVIKADQKDLSVEIGRYFVLEGNASVLCDKLTDGKLDIKLVNEGQVIRAQHI